MTAEILPQILHQTPEWLVVNKPAGWLTIPGRGSSPVLQAWLTERHGPLWVVHRLDRDTSGVILFAKTPEAHRKAGLWFQDHQVRKTYDCVAQGVAAMPMFRIDQPIEGAKAVTQIEVRKQGAEAFHARVSPLTGKRHQIRIHLSSRGHPLWGDPEYGGPREAMGIAIPRVALHASELRLPSGEKFSAPWPGDLAGWIGVL